MEDHVASDRVQRRAPAQGQEVRKRGWGGTQVGRQAERVALRILGTVTWWQRWLREAGTEGPWQASGWVEWTVPYPGTHPDRLGRSEKEAGVRECCQGACLDVCGHPWGANMGLVLSSWKIGADRCQYFIGPEFWQKNPKHSKREIIANGSLQLLSVT